MSICSMSGTSLCFLLLPFDRKHASYSAYGMDDDYLPHAIFQPLIYSASKVDVTHRFNSTHQACHAQLTYHHPRDNASHYPERLLHRATLVLRLEC